MVVTNTDEEMDNAESTSDSENSDSVEWTDVSADDAVDGSRNGPDRPTESVDASSADSHSTPDTAATSDEVDSMDADQLLGTFSTELRYPHWLSTVQVGSHISTVMRVSVLRQPRPQLLGLPRQQSTEAKNSPHTCSVKAQKLMSVERLSSSMAPNES